jgi:hypothetical protein
MFGVHLPLSLSQVANGSFCLSMICTRMTWFYLLKIKDKVPRIVKEFHAMVIIQFKREIKMIRSDNGIEL